jgi:hypothetical protein
MSSRWHEKKKKLAELEFERDLLSRPDDTTIHVKVRYSSANERGLQKTRMMLARNQSLVCLCLCVCAFSVNFTCNMDLTYSNNMI